MVSSIFFNKKDSFRDFKLIIEKPPDFNFHKNIYNEISIPGGGVLHELSGEKDAPFLIGFTFICNDEELFEIKNKINNWLKNSISQELIYSFNKMGYYKVKKIEIGEVTTSSRIVRKFTVNFTIYPYLFLFEGNNIITLNAPENIFNVRATCKSKPCLNIYGNGDITININSQSLILKNVNNNIIVDSFIGDCYKILNNDLVHLNNKMYSKFPILEAEENNISWSGNVTKIEILPRWCCYL